MFCYLSWDPLHARWKKQLWLFEQVTIQVQEVELGGGAQRPGSFLSTPGHRVLGKQLSADNAEMHRWPFMTLSHRPLHHHHHRHDSCQKPSIRTDFLWQSMHVITSPLIIIFMPFFVVSVASPVCLFHLVKPVYLQGNIFCIFFLKNMLKCWFEFSKIVSQHYLLYKLVGWVVHC